MLKSKKNVFWEALLVTTVIFILGIFIGIAIEEARIQEVNKVYIESEILLMDALTYNNLINLETEQENCGELVSLNEEFANKIYEEARLLDKYESSGKITEGAKLAHKRYDLMRTLLWINTIKMKESCDTNVSTVVYLYEQDTEDLAKKATQSVWSKILIDLKEEKGAQIILIPIAVDSNISSLDSLTNIIGVRKFPVVVINEKEIITALQKKEDLEKYLTE